MVQDNMLGRVILYLLESLSICAVNCFMIISGYFLAYNKKVKLATYAAKCAENATIT